MSLKKIFIYITLIILTIIGVFFYYINRPNYQICHVEKNNFYINNIKLELESACTLKQLEQGLMFRNSLDKNKGMIFIFPEKNHKASSYAVSLCPETISQRTAPPHP